MLSSSETLKSLLLKMGRRRRLVSRPDELARASKASLARFGMLKVLHEGAETDDGDDTLPAESPYARIAREGIHRREGLGHYALPWVLFDCEGSLTGVSIRGTIPCLISYGRHRFISLRVSSGSTDFALQLAGKKFSCQSLQIACVGVRIQPLHPRAHSMARVRVWD